MVRRLVREAAILGRLDHEHIVGVLDAGVSEDGAFLAMEVFDGASFAVVLDAVRRAGLSTATGATVGAALVGALFLHYRVPLVVSNALDLSFGGSSLGGLRCP